MPQLTQEQSFSISLFALGFRAFFLLAGIAALVLMGLWGWAYHGHSLNNYYGALGWHSHEMIFGYTCAVIAGFLLTAVGNWTGRPTLTGKRLAILCVLWLYGRIMPFFPDSLPDGLIAIVDLAFLPALAVIIGISIVRAKKLLNLVFVILLAVMTAANALIHCEVLGITESGTATGTRLALAAVIIMIIVIAGRIFPFFTERGLPGTTPRRSPLLDRLCIAAVASWFAADVFYPSAELTGMLALLAAGLNTARLAGWYSHRIWTVPLLWVLYSGYGWIIFGFVLGALAAFGQVIPSIAIHALTVGGIGVLTLGMMARVSLGHTGHPLKAAQSIAVSFFLINVAALVRVLLPIAFQNLYSHFILLSTLLWISAFALFIFVYSPILTAPRVDGRPG